MLKRPAPVRASPFVLKYFVSLCTVILVFTENAYAKKPGSATRAEHVVVVVWDGMRPDFVRPEYTPVLCQLASNGVFFTAHHPVYVSSTEVNGAALATGDYPHRSGIIANREYRPEINWLEPCATESMDTIRRGDELSGGHYLFNPTIAETVQRAGFATAVAGTKPVALFQDRSLSRKPGSTSAVLYNGRTIPSALVRAIIECNGKDFPTNTTPNVGRDTWTTKGLTEVLWKTEVPRFSLLWMSEPDASQHPDSPGSTNALAAIRNNDRNLAAVLEALDKKGVKQSTDVLVVSDHGFSTISRTVDVAEVLKAAGFNASRKLDDPEPGQIVVDGLGGSDLFYVFGHEPNGTRELIRCLQKSDFAGVILSRLSAPGTFSLSEVRLDSGKNEPDVVASLRWDNGTNRYGAPGLMPGDTNKTGSGAHASLSRYDMHNTLVACGPSFRKGFVNILPTGNADVAPTILSILGIKPTRRMEGRVLVEALAEPGRKIPACVTTTRIAETEVDGKRWRQYLKVSMVEGSVYFDEGNGGVEP
jgi:predicted AlkP superfamily pyrophosphatase or phosphodiesterase